MSEPSKNESRKVSIFLPQDGDHGNEEETIGTHCNVLNVATDTTTSRRRQSWANENRRKHYIISENGGYKRKQSTASVLSECLHVDIDDGNSKLNYRISQNPPFHLTIFFALQVSILSDIYGSVHAIYHISEDLFFCHFMKHDEICI